MRQDFWAVFPKPNPHARARLFCFPYAGAGASAFSAWPAALPCDVEICAVQLPGRERRLREPLYTDFGILMDAVAPALDPYLDRPFAFFGHSNGALMAFELARELRRAGKPLPLHLIVSGRNAPQLPRDRRGIHQLPDPEFLEEVRQFRGTPAEILANREFMEFLLPILRADFALGETYTYAVESPLDVPIAAFAGVRDPAAPIGPVSSWREQTTGPFQARVFDGTHFFIHEEAGAVLRAVEMILDRCLLADASPCS